MTVEVVTIWAFALVQAYQMSVFILDIYRGNSLPSLKFPPKLVNIIVQDYFA